MKRRTFFATIAAAFAAKPTLTAFGHVPFGSVLADNSLVLLPEGAPPFPVGQKLSREYLIDNATTFKSINTTCDLIDDPWAPNDNWRHWIPINIMVEIETFDGWTIWLRRCDPGGADPKQRYYLVTEVTFTAEETN